MGFSSEQEVAAAIRESIESSIPDSKAEVTAAGGGHYALVVTAAAFEGQKVLAKQRMVLSSIKHLMGDDSAPVHAIDSIKTLLPGA